MADASATKDGIAEAKIDHSAPDFGFVPVPEIPGRETTEDIGGLGSPIRDYTSPFKAGGANDR